MNYADNYLWKDSERAGDVWNGRWSRQTLEDILQEHSDYQIPPPIEYTAAFHRHYNSRKPKQLFIQQGGRFSGRLPVLLQNITLHQPRQTHRGPRLQTLFSAWHIQYSRGIHPLKPPPRYLYRSDLAPQPTPLRQTVLGYRAMPTPADLLNSTEGT
jgi:hypothetical protein